MMTDDLLSLNTLMNEIFTKDWKTYYYVKEIKKKHKYLNRYDAYKLEVYKYVFGSKDPNDKPIYESEGFMYGNNVIYYYKH